MKVKKIIETKLEITGATLLSIEEAEALPIRLRKYQKWWWLRSPSQEHNSCSAAIVFSFGLIYKYGTDVTEISLAVRPALQIKNLESSNLKIGDIFELGGVEFEIISKDMAFCLKDIGEYQFRMDWEADNANDYEKSDVKKYIDDWFKKEIEQGKEIKNDK